MHMLLGFLRSRMFYLICSFRIKEVVLPQGVSSPRTRTDFHVQVQFFGAKWSIKCLKWDVFSYGIICFSKSQFKHKL